MTQQGWLRAWKYCAVLSPPFPFSSLLPFLLFLLPNSLPYFYPWSKSQHLSITMISIYTKQTISCKLTVKRIFVSPNRNGWNLSSRLASLGCLVPEKRSQGCPAMTSLMSFLGDADKGKLTNHVEHEYTIYGETACMWISHRLCCQGIIKIRIEWVLWDLLWRGRHEIMRPKKLATCTGSHSWWQSRPRAQTNWAWPRTQHRIGHRRAHAGFGARTDQSLISVGHILAAWLWASFSL